MALSSGDVPDMYTCIGWNPDPTERARATAYRAIRNEVACQVGEAKRLPVLIIDVAQLPRHYVLEDLQLSDPFFDSPCAHLWSDCLPGETTDVVG